MNIKRTLFWIIALCILAAVVAAIAMNIGTKPSLLDSASGSQSRAMPVEDYVRLNISELSPVKESLGGTFYVTSIEAQDGEGTVAYEDGHNAYIADFTYRTDQRGAITIDSFEVRE